MTCTVYMCWPVQYMTVLNSRDGTPWAILSNPSFAVGFSMIKGLSD